MEEINAEIEALPFLTIRDKETNCPVSLEEYLNHFYLHSKPIDEIVELGSPLYTDIGQYRIHYFYVTCILCKKSFRMPVGSENLETDTI